MKISFVLFYMGGYVLAMLPEQKVIESIRITYKGKPQELLIKDIDEGRLLFQEHIRGSFLHKISLSKNDVKQLKKYIDAHRALKEKQRRRKREAFVLYVDVINNFVVSQEDPPNVLESIFKVISETRRHLNYLDRHINRLDLIKTYLKEYRVSMRNYQLINLKEKYKDRADIVEYLVNQQVSYLHELKLSKSELEDLIEYNQITLDNQTTRMHVLSDMEMRLMLEPDSELKSFIRSTARKESLEILSQCIMLAEMEHMKKQKNILKKLF